MSSSIILEGGKYTVLHDNGFGLRALRHGRPWREMTGDGLVLAMAQRIEELEAERSRSTPERSEIRGKIPTEDDLWKVLDAAVNVLTRRAAPHAWESESWNAGAALILKRRAQLEASGDTETDEAREAWVRSKLDTITPECLAFAQQARAKWTCSENEGFAVEMAYQYGASTIDEDPELLVISAENMVNLMAALGFDHRAPGGLRCIACPPDEEKEWKRVPVEPTPAMWDAGNAAFQSPVCVYQAMLAAAPAQDPLDRPFLSADET